MHLRVSGAMAIAVGLLEAYFVSFGVLYARDYGHSMLDWYVIVPGGVSAVVFVGAGAASQFRIGAVPLAAAWGWLLGSIVPRLLQRVLLPLPQIPSELLRQRNTVFFKISPDYALESTLIAIAVLGIVLCYLADRRRKFLEA